MPLDMNCRAGKDGKFCRNDETCATWVNIQSTINADTGCVLVWDQKCDIHKGMSEYSNQWICPVNLCDKKWDKTGVNFCPTHDYL